MVDRTSTECAPWAFVSSEGKDHAWVTVLKAMCERLEAAL